MTLKSMRDRVVAELGLQDIAAYDETALVNGELNRGVIDLLARTRCVVRCLHLKTTAGVDTYTLSHAVLSLVEVENGARRARRDEARYASGWDGVVYPGSNGYQGGGFTLIRSDVLRIPTPGEDGEVDVWAVLRPTPMGNDDDSPGAEQFGAIPDEFQDAIVLYALWQCSSYADDASAGQGERYRMQYEGQDQRGGKLREIRMMVNKRGTARAPRARGRVRAVSGRSSWVG